MDDELVTSLNHLAVIQHQGQDEKCRKNAKNRTTEKSIDFDEIVGHMEDMLLDERFYRLQESFLEEHWSEFDNTEENKHSYMEIFISYTNTIEGFIEHYLQMQMPQFTMGNFIREVEKRRHELDGEIFEMLFTLTDFTAFKEMILDYKNMKEHGEVDLSSALSIVQFT